MTAPSLPAPSGAGDLPPSTRLGRTVGRPPRRRRRGRPVALAALAVLALAGCSAIGSTPAAAPSSSGGGSVTLVTHDSFVLPDGMLADFTARTGITVSVVQQGDAGALVNQLVLTKDSPLGDAVFGIDNTFGSRALDEGLVTPAHLTAPALADATKHSLPGDSAGALTAIDDGDVCLNVDHAWFTAKGLPEPVTLQDLTKPEYKDLLVVPSPVTSSPGFAFLLATVGAFGPDGWQGYWSALKANGLQVANGWTDAYETDFTAGGGNGSRPIVLSYSSSPPSTVPDGGSQPTTGALLSTCFRQTEYAGVLTGAKNPEGAAKLIDFLLSDEVQAAIPDAMYMYPVSTAVTLPTTWASFAPLATTPYDVDPAAIAANRQTWLQQWSDLVTG
ncbi:thiamine ABC transporter substrate-binding protein [Cellulomonas citrea]|uniref:thiamine ABC transporter substrate-binding protein n=1 Tax=Cellulomonas citrea TaxID=1909423 RepID=UPI00135B2A64|nr:thiamine ABC transporter substrate-binding protein [Cellulomonas citrea]